MNGKKLFFNKKIPFHRLLVQKSKIFIRVTVKSLLPASIVNPLAYVSVAPPSTGQLPRSTANQNYTFYFVRVDALHPRASCRPTSRKATRFRAVGCLKYLLVLYLPFQKKQIRTF